MIRVIVKLRQGDNSKIYDVVFTDGKREIVLYSSLKIVSAEMFAMGYNQCMKDLAFGFKEKRDNK